MTLKELRHKYEAGCTRLFETMVGSNVYVLLKDQQQGLYHFYRYHEIGKDRWGIDFDIEKRPAEYMMKELVRIFTKRRKSFS